MTTDYKTSILVNRQLPEFVRDEYPLFQSFLEAYYEFLEQQQGTEQNDLITKAKDLRYISDVDYSIDEFEQQFFNTFAALFPRDVSVDKAFLIKHVLPLYLSKGSEKSFKLLFRMLYGQELDVSYPKNNILRASDGKWLIENIVKVTTDIYSYYTGNGSTKEFYLIQIVGQSVVTVYVNDVLQTSGYYVHKESQKIVFDSAPANNSTIKVYYSNLNYDVFTNRKIHGVTSGASAIVEKVLSRFINNDLVIELFVNSKTLVGNFEFGEKLTVDIIGPDGNLIDVSLQSFSALATINLLYGGSSYNVGDPVIVNAPNSIRTPSAIVSKTFKGTIDSVTVNEGGAGFATTPTANVVAVGYLPTQLLFHIGAVNTYGANSSNTFTIFTDIISDVDPANTVLSASNWHFSGNSGGGSNLNSNIIQVLANTSYTSIGEISTVAIDAANAVVTTPPTLNATPAVLNIAPQTANTSTYTKIYIDTFGSLGKLIINNGGTGYAVGDELVFTNQPMSFGIGAAGEVATVDGSGTITKVQFVPTKITGTANIQSSNVMIVGTGTSFKSELHVGDSIKIGSNTRKVTIIASDTSLNVDSAFGETANNKYVRLWNKYMLGGENYAQNKLPTVTVTSSGGTNANISVTAIMGDGENLSVVTGNNRPGEIQEITITDAGKGLIYVPAIDLSKSGDGTATANATVSQTFEVLPGRWTTSDSILSSSERKLEGRDYYVDYSYVTASTTEFAKYKKIFNDLLHPSGFKAYGELIQQNQAQTIIPTFSYTNTAIAISGTANVKSGSIYVTGMNTKFNVANTTIFTIGSQIAINTEIRTISSVISNTNLAVSSAFTITSNNEDIVVIS